MSSCLPQVESPHSYELSVLFVELVKVTSADLPGLNYWDRFQMVWFN